MLTVTGLPAPRIAELAAGARLVVHEPPGHPRGAQHGARRLDRRRTAALAALTPRERDVLALMAEGRSNAAIAGLLVVSERAIEKHVGNIFSKLGLPPSDADHRRVLAVLRYLES